MHDAGSRARVGAVVFNNVKLLNKTKGDVCGSPAALSFTPPGPAKKSIEEIVEHLHQMCTEPNTNFKARAFVSECDCSLVAHAPAPPAPPRAPLPHPLFFAPSQEYFEDGSAFGSAQAFAKRYVTGLATVPDSVWQECTSSGTPVVAMTGGGEPRKGAADQVEDVAKRILFQ